MTSAPRCITILPALLVLVPCGMARAGSVVYVNAAAGGADTGANWADAFTDLQAALEAAVAPGGGVTQIWVAGGTYRRRSGRTWTIPSRDVPAGQRRGALRRFGVGALCGRTQSGDQRYDPQR